MPALIVVTRLMDTRSLCACGLDFHSLHRTSARSSQLCATSSEKASLTAHLEKPSACRLPLALWLCLSRKVHLAPSPLQSLVFRRHDSSYFREVFEVTDHLFWSLPVSPGPRHPDRWVCVAQDEQ